MGLLVQGVERDFWGTGTVLFRGGARRIERAHSSRRATRLRERFHIVSTRPTAVNVQLPIRSENASNRS